MANTNNLNITSTDSGFISAPNTSFSKIFLFNFFPLSNRPFSRKHEFHNPTCDAGSFQLSGEPHAEELDLCQEGVFLCTKMIYKL